MWSWYNEVAGSVALTYSEIGSWANLTGKDIEPREVKIIMALDRIYWRSVNE